MTRVAFLTLADREGYVIDDGLAIGVLGDRGVAVDEAPWRGQADWSAYDGVVVRTPWDYQHDPAGFLAVLDDVVAAGVPLANSLAVIRWNLHKGYLRDLDSAGVAIVPTQWGRGLSGARLQALVGEECVLKPVIGANAGDTFRLAPGLALGEAERIAGLYPDREWMLQPFVQAVVTEGEYSLFYFGGVYSHAIVKRPATGDFRVQEDHGGRIAAVDADAALTSAGRAALDAMVGLLGEVPLQARVDLVRLDDGRLALIELELIEPSLYFRHHPHAASNFATATLDWLDRTKLRD